MRFGGHKWRQREGKWLSLALAFLLLAGVIFIPCSYPRTAYAEDESEITAGYFNNMDQPQVKSVIGVGGISTNNKAGKYTSVTADAYGDFVAIGELRGTVPESINPAAAAVQAKGPTLITKTGRDRDGNLKTMWTQGLYVPGGIRTDSYGSFITLFDIEPLADGGYVAVGHTNYGVGWSDGTPVDIPVRDFRGKEWNVRLLRPLLGSSNVAIAVKLNAGGDIERLIQLNGDTPGSTYFWSVAASADGGFAAVGYTTAEGGVFSGLGEKEDESLSFLAKYDAAGNREKVVGFSGDYIGEIISGLPGYTFWSIAALPDGGYAIGGESNAFSDIVSSAEPDQHYSLDSDPAKRSAAFLMKLDAEGRIDWAKVQHSELSSGLFEDVAVDNSGNITAAGYMSFGTNAAAIIGKYGADGTLIASRALVGNDTRDTYGQLITGPDALHSVIPLDDGGYLFAGQALSTANDYGGETLSSIGGNRGGRDYFVLKTDGNLSTEWLSFAGGSANEAFEIIGIEQVTDILALTDDGFVLAGDSPSLDGDFAGLNGSPTISQDPANTGNAVLALFTYDWDGDGVRNSRDFYPLNPAKSIPEGSYAVQLNLDGPSVVTATYSVYAADVKGIPLVSGQEVPNISVTFDGAKLTAPVPVFDRIFKGLNHTLTFGYTNEIPGFETEAVPLLPAKRIYSSAFELSANMDGGGVTDFGTAVKVTVPISGIDHPYSAKLYYYNPSGPVLEEVSGADFSQEGMVTFRTSHFSRYVITGATTDQLEVDAVIAKIAALPPEVSLMQKPLVEEARAAYEALTPEQQALVTNYSKLTNLEAQLVAREELKNNLIAVNPVIEKISNLPDPVTLDDRAAIEEARAAYDALTEVQKGLVDNIDKLLAAEAQIVRLQDQAAGDAVIQLINALPDAVSLADKSKVTAARNAYNALTAAQKALVTNYGKLTNAEAQINIQQSQVNALQAERNSLQSALISVILSKPAASSSAAPVTSVNGSAEVVPKMGGTVSLGSSAIVEIPAGALSGEAKVNVKIRQVDNPPAAPFTLTVVSSVYEFTAGSAATYRFTKPVTVTLAFDPSKVPNGKQAAMYYYDDAAGKWTRIGGTVNGGGISAVVYHFTKFAVFAEFPQMAKTSGNTGTLKDTVNHWAKNYIDNLRQRGVIGGYPDGTFQPNRTITRAEFATLLVKALGLKGTGEAGFSDIEGHWAKGEILTAASHQIVNGYPDGKFLPDYPVTREEMVVMTVYAFQLTQKTALAFGDNGEISDWAKSGVEAAVASGIISGQPGNRFAPKATATRAEAATVLVKALELE
ncbi:S-layer homology domain-containing protein [Paenibacillus durus]|uniref:S-layer homology domain-containing protein n=1 Tax=Paenibacillus durus TaxID=44251 RepID=UPI0006939C85|nr:S-layer homology domain-containing protein [Paenibacillus durus]